MFGPMSRNQRKAGYLAMAAFAVGIVGLSIEAIPSVFSIAAFLIGAAFWWKAMFRK